MNLSEVFNQLSNGELSQINMGGQTGDILPENYRKMVAHVNLGLTALYKRFPLKEERITLALQTGQTLYHLKAAYAVSNDNSTEVLRYLIDTENAPFLGSLIKVERIYTDAGYELALNDKSEKYSLFTPSFNRLIIPVDMVTDGSDLPEELMTDTLDIVYRDNHYALTEDVGYDSPEDVELELPDTHLEALLYFIASRVHNPIGFDNQFHAGNNYAAKYEAECQRLEQANVAVDQGSQSDRLVRNGWV